MTTIAEQDSRPVAVDWQQTDLYRFFALVFSSPNLECFKLLSQASTATALCDLWQHLGLKEKFPGFEWFASCDLYESAYISLFDVGLPEPPVPLFESAHDKSHPVQEIALENTYFYDVLGLRSDARRAVPDYLITQLEFLAALRYTREHTAEANLCSLQRVEKDFLERHLLNWVPKAKSKLERLGAPGFPQLMTLLVQFLNYMQTVIMRGARIGKGVENVELVLGCENQVQNLSCVGAEIAHAAHARLRPGRVVRAITDSRPNAK